jgi:hypothetical protein
VERACDVVTGERQGLVTTMMAVTRVRRAFGVLPVVAAMLLAGTPANVPAPFWPPTGYTPTCDTVFRDDADWHYYDRTPPTIVSFHVPKYLALTSVPTNFTIATGRVTDSCSGLSTIVSIRSYQGALIVLKLGPVDVAPFDATFAPTQSLGLTGTHLGPVQWESVYALDRFSEFKLSLDHKSLLSFVGRKVVPSAYGTLALPPTAVTFLVRKTYVSTPSRNHSSVTKGSGVTFSARLTVATTMANANLPAVRVSLQRHYRGGSWVTIKLTTTKGNGTAVFHVKPVKTASYRIAYAGLFADPWNAPVTSRSVSVGVR